MNLLEIKWFTDARLTKKNKKCNNISSIRYLIFYIYIYIYFFLLSYVCSKVLST